MKLKRILAIVLCFAMVFSTMSFSVFATETTYVAKIGETPFETLAAAIEAANADDEIDLYADVEQIPTITKAITIDGNNYRVTAKADENQFGEIDGTVTLKNLIYDNGTEAIRTDYGNYGGESDGYTKLSLVIDGCTFNNLTGYAIMGGQTTNKTLGALTVTGCTFNAGSECDNYMVYAQNVGKLTVTDCTFNGDGVTKGAIHTGDSTTTATVAKINGGEISGVERGIQICNRVEGSSVSVDGVAFDGVTAAEGEKTGAIYVYEYATTPVSATNNTFVNCTNVVSTNNTTEGFVSTIITTFTGNTADNKNVVLKPDGTVSEAAPASEYKAYIGEQGYGDLAAAINAATDSQIIKLATDTSVTGATVDQGKAITIDLNGKNLELAVTGFAFSPSNSITVNGQLTFTGEGNVSVNVSTTPMNMGSAIHVADGGKLILESGSFSFPQTCNGAVAVVYGEMVINGGTLESNGNTSMISTPDSANITITGGEFKTFPMDTGDGKTVSISGGTFPIDSEIPESWLAEGYMFDAETGKIVETSDPSVATVSTYAELVAALENTEIKIIKFANDITVPANLNVSRTVTIDGCGFDINYTNAGETARVITVLDTANGASLTVKNLEINFEGGWTERAINYNTGGTLTIENVKVNGEDVNYAVNLPGSSDGATVIIKDSELTAAIPLNIWGTDVTATVTDSKLIVVDETDVESYAAVAVNDGADNTNVTVTGGEIYAMNGSVPYRNYGVNSTVTISDTTYVTTEDDSIETIVVAKVAYAGSTQHYSYADLKNAVAKAENDPNATVVLLNDTELNAPVKVTGTVTVDLNGKKIAGPDVPATQSYYAFIVDGGDLTLKDESAEQTGEIWAKCYGVETKSGSFTMESGKITATNNKTLGSAVVNYGGTVTINGGVLNGALSSVTTGGYFSEAATVIKGGTLTGPVALAAEYDVKGSAIKSASADHETVDGYTWKLGEDELYELIKANVVMDGVYYATIKDAFDTLRSADTTIHKLKVFEDHKINVNYSTHNYPILVNGFAVEIDLNGKTITADWSEYTGSRVDNALIGVANGGKLTIIDGVGGGKIVNNDTKENVENRIFWIMNSTADKSIEVVIKGGTFIQNDINTALLYVQGNKPSDNLAQVYVTIEGGHFETVNDDFFNAYDGFQHESYITGGTFNKNPSDWEIKIADGFIVEENPDGTYGVEVDPRTTYRVASKEELKDAVSKAVDGDIILLTADIDYGVELITIDKPITLDLGGNTLTTRWAYGGMFLKNNPTVKNGTIIHASNTTAIRAWKVAAFEDLVIDVQGKGDANKVIGGIVIQNDSTNRVEIIKNVTIKGDALTNGIETYNCGDAAEPVIGSMENVTIDAVGTAMNISAPVGTATNCTFAGDVNGIEIWIKGTYSASLNLVDCDVTGGVFAHDEFNSNPSTVNKGTISLTVDEATTGVALDDITMTISRIEENQTVGIINTFMEKAVASVNGTLYLDLAEAVAAAAEGQTVTLLRDVELADDVDITDGMNVTIEGAGKTIAGAEEKDVFYVTGGKLTLNEGLNVYAPTDCCIYIRGGEVVTSANLTKNGTKYSVIQGNGQYEGNVTINGGKVENLIPEKVAIYWPQNGKLTINGGDIIGGTGIRLSSGSLEITGGTVTANGAANDYVASNGGSVADTGDAVMIENIGDTEGYEAISSVSITGGTFKSANAEAVASYTAGNEGVDALTGFITGGVFYSKPADNLAASGYSWVMTGNKYEVQMTGDYFFVVDPAETELVEGTNETFTVDVKVASEKVDTFYTAEYIVKYDTTLLTCAEDNAANDYDKTEGVLRLQALGTNTNVGESIGTLTFTAKKFDLTVETEIEVTGSVLATQFDSITENSVEAGKGTGVVVMKETLEVAVGEGLEGANVAYNGTDYVISVAEENQGKQNTIKYTINGVENEVVLPAGTNEYTIDGDKILGDMTFEITDTFTVTVIAPYVTGYALVLVEGTADGYTYDGHQMFKIDRAIEGATVNYNGRYGWLVDGSAPGTTIASVTEDAYKAITADGVSKPVETTCDVNSCFVKDGKINFQDVSAAYACQRIDFALTEADMYYFMDLYLASDVNCDGIVNVLDTAMISNSYN